MKRKSSSALESSSEVAAEEFPPRLDPARATSVVCRIPPTHAACLVVSHNADGLKRHAFHFVDAACSKTRSTVVHGAGGPQAPYRFDLAGTCNGLVLVTAPWSNDGNCIRGVLFNPATGEEETLLLHLPAPYARSKTFLVWCFCGLGYSPSSKTYKALICARNMDGVGELMVVLLAAASRQEPKLVQVIQSKFEAYPISLTMDGKVYVLIDDTESTVLVFDVADETVTRAAPIPHGAPRGRAPPRFDLMELWGRPCVAMRDGPSIALWVLTPDDHAWERRCRLVVLSCPSCGLAMQGAWPCGGDGLLLALFRDGRGSMYYDLVREGGGVGTDGPALVTLRPTEEVAAKTSLAEMQKGFFCWGFRPTLVRLASVFGDGACSDESCLRHFSSGGERQRGKSPPVLGGALDLRLDG